MSPTCRAAALAAAIGRNESLTEVTLTACSLGTSGYAALAIALRARGAPLQSLTVSFREVDPGSPVGEGQADGHDDGDAFVGVLFDQTAPAATAGGVSQLLSS